MEEEGDGMPFVLNGYEFQNCIGQGTYSTAFKVFSLQYQRHFCAKMTEVDDSFFDEAGNPCDPELNALISLDNQNIIKVYSFFRSESMFFLILELCEGGTLADRIRQLGRMEVNVIRVIMTDILSALVYCHEQHIAHRDIKPQNIFMDAYGHARVGDFGLSSILQPHQLVDTACGSPSYACPEIYGRDAYDPFKADVWALGVTLYQMAVGCLPWPDEITVAGPARPPPAFPSFLDPGIANLIVNMFRRDPTQRPTMRQILSHPFFAYRDGPVTPRYQMRKNAVRAALSMRSVTGLAGPGSKGRVPHPMLQTPAAARLTSRGNSLFDTRRSSARVLVHRPLTFTTDSETE